MTTLNRITGVVAGEYGTKIIVPVVDKDGNALPLTSYTGVTVKALSPDHQTLLTFTGTIEDAANGLVSFTPTSTNYFTRDGTWLGQIRLTAASVLAPTVPFEIPVESLL